MATWFANLRKKIHFVRTEGVFAAPGNSQNPQERVSADQRQIAEGVQALGGRFPAHLRGNILPVQSIDYPRCAVLEGVAHPGALNRDQGAFREHSPAFRKIQGVNAQMAAFGVRQQDGCCIATHHPADASRCGEHKVVEIQIGDHLVGQLEN